MKKRATKTKKKADKIKKAPMKKGPLFVANVISAIILAYFAVVSPTITGLSIAKTNLDLTSPPDFAILFIIVVFALDIYFYARSRRIV
jgi:hypothetical protein|tara:strand:- start:314 stop:577 length:264 start_codon:yes stop_codon:yes gene_type:complete